MFFLTGLWHGADLSFIIWGLYHGSFSILERAGLKNVLKKSKLISAVYTFFLVTIGWVLFRANDTLSGLRYIAHMLLPWRYRAIQNIAQWHYMSKKTIFIFLCAFIGMGFINRFTPEKIKDYWNGSIVEAIYCVFIMLLCLASIASNTYNPFIYFQF